MQKIIKIKNSVSFHSYASVGGREEREGPLGDGFDFCDRDDTFGMKTWEKAESEMGRLCLNLALKKGGLSQTDIDLIAAGDLQNQCAATSFGLHSFGAPVIGLYGACSTCCESLAVLAAILDGWEGSGLCASVTTSHNATAERQFRTPLEYGGQRARTAQWTATAAGAFILGKDCGSARIRDVMMGIPKDGGTTDTSNMGPAMAFAARDTVISYFEKSELSPSDFDFIVTGDLGYGGSSLLCELLSKKDKRLADIHVDCGTLLYNRNTQDAHSGSSGCGTSASVLACHFLPKIEKGEIKRILFLSTGALMNSTTTLQGENIIGIAPAVRIEHDIRGRGQNGA